MANIEFKNIINIQIDSVKKTFYVEAGDLKGECAIADVVPDADEFISEVIRKTLNINSEEIKTEVKTKLQEQIAAMQLCIDKINEVKEVKK